MNAPQEEPVEVVVEDDLDHRVDPDLLALYEAGFRHPDDEGPELPGVDTGESIS